MMNNLISSILVFILSLIPTQLNYPNEILNNQTEIIFTGDIMLGRSVMGASLDNNDSNYAFQKTADFLKNANLTVGNLENPIVSSCKRHVGGFTFCTTPEISKSLNYAGFDIVSLANNHTSNYGENGIIDTHKYLDEYNISYVGENNLVIKEINGTKFGFLGFNYTFGTSNLQKDIELIANSNNEVDVLFVTVHWGEEYKDTANKFQKDTALKMVEAGADTIIGHHPHWVQNYEEINGVPVYYSLGNFVFDQMWSEETKKGLIVKMIFEDGKLIKREEHRTYISKIGQPEIIMESPNE